MTNAVPAVLSRLLVQRDPSRREDAWAEFVASYSKLILYVARRRGGDHDAVMDRYTAVLDGLRQDDFRRLRTYVADGRSEFSTWLVVVAQRICLDQRRHRYGRPRPPVEDQTSHDEEWAARRRLVDLLSAEIDLSSVADNEAVSAEETIRLADLYHALQAALGLLQPQDRLLIKLRFEDDLPMPEIARSLQFPTRFHAYRRLTHVLGDLRHALEDSGVRDAIA
jgi:RNA polymerase sigma factor (sigma-70 family)